MKISLKSAHNKSHSSTFIANEWIFPHAWRYVQPQFISRLFSWSYHACSSIWFASRSRVYIKMWWWVSRRQFSSTRMFTSLTRNTSWLVYIVIPVLPYTVKISTRRRKISQDYAKTPNINQITINVAVILMTNVPKASPWTPTSFETWTKECSHIIQPAPISGIKNIQTT